MVETISPVVHGGRARWLGTLVLHTLGATVTAARSARPSVGSAGYWVRPGSARDRSCSRRSRRSTRRRADTIARAGPATPPAGAGLVADVLRAVVRGRCSTAPASGIGFMTYLSYGTLVVVAFAAAASGRPAMGALVVGPFGLFAGCRRPSHGGRPTQEQSRALVDRLVAAPGRSRGAANGVVLVLIAFAAVVASVRGSRRLVGDPRRRGARGGVLVGRCVEGRWAAPMAPCAGRPRPVPRARADGRVGGPGGGVVRARPRRRRPAPRGRRLVGSAPRGVLAALGPGGRRVGFAFRADASGAAVIST